MQFLKIEEMESPLEILLSTNPPEEVLKKVKFLKSLKWDFLKHEHEQKEEKNTKIILVGNAYDSKGIKALRYCVSINKKEEKELLDFSSLEFFDVFGTKIIWNKNGYNLSYSNSDE